MKINVTDLSVAQIVEPSTIILGGRVVYTMNFRPEYNSPSEEEGSASYDPEYIDQRERFEALEDSCNG